MTNRFNLTLFVAIAFSSMVTLGVGMRAGAPADQTQRVAHTSGSDAQAAPIWKHTGVHVSQNWPNATARRGVVNAFGGEVELGIRGTREYYCPQAGVEHVLFKWDFDRDITKLRAGEDIEVRLHISPTSHDNLCTGQLEKASVLEALTSNSAGYTDAEGQLFEDRIVWKTGDGALGGDRQPDRRNAVSVLTVHPNPVTSKNRMRFTIRLSGPCDHPQPYSCGTIYYKYDYELDNGRGEGLLTSEKGIDRPGSDYRNFNLTAADPELCRSSCAVDKMCRAYTYVRPNVQGPTARCWLKNTVPKSVPSDCCTSGVKP